MTDPIQTALARSPTLDDPNILREDDPPMLRFERVAVEDRHVTEETGMYGYKDMIMVHVRAYGDIKTEVPNIVWTTVHVPVFEDVMVRKSVPVILREVDNAGRTVEREILEERDTTEQRPTFHVEEVWPWFEKLDERLRNGQISQNYRDHCRRAFKKWEETGAVPIDGTPVITWRMISPAQQARLVDMGINTVELTADMTEDAMQQFGMGSQDIKKKAKEWVAAENDTSKAAAKVVSLESSLSASSEENNTLKSKLAELEGLLLEQAEKEAG